MNAASIFADGEDQIQRTLLAEKYGSTTRPVRLAMTTSWSHFRLRLVPVTTTWSRNVKIVSVAVLTISDHILTHEALPADQRETSFGAMVEVALEAAFA